MIEAASHFLDSLRGLEGLAALITSLIAVFKIHEVKKDTTELQPNHGSSIKDAVQRVEKSLDRSQARLDNLESGLSRVEKNQDRFGYELGGLKRQSEREHGDYDERIRALEQHQHK